MKKLFYIFTLIGLFILPVSRVKAYKLSLTGSDKIDSSAEYVLTLTDIEDAKGFYGFVADLDYDDKKLELLSIEATDNLNLTYSAVSKKMLIYIVTGIDSKQDLIKLKFKNIGLQTDEEVTVAFDNILATDSEKDIEVDKTSIKIKATKEGTKTNNNLETIKINGKPLDLSDGEIHYEIVVSNDTKKIDVKALAEDSEATVLGNGKYELTEGTNEIKIEVKDKDGDIKTYTIDVNRESKDAKINDEDLFIKGKTFNFLYLIPVGVILLGIIVLIIKRKGMK